MKKVVFAGMFVLGSSLLETYATGGNFEGTCKENGNTSTAMQLVQTEDNEGFVGQPAQTADAGELTVADLKLNDFREEFKTLMYSCISEVYGEQAKEDPKFKLLATVLDDKHKSQMQTLAMLAQSKMDNQKDIHDREMEVRAAQLEEARNEKIRIEKENEFKKKIGMILSHNCIDSRDIIKNAEAEFLSMDLPNRYHLLSTLYNKKFQPFSELLEANDLSAVCNYINAINVPVPRTELEDFQGYYFGWGYESYTQWNYRNIAEIRRAKSYGANIPGHEGIQESKPWIYPLTFWANAAHADLIESERQRINQIIREERNNYDRAKELVFPSEEFKRIVEKVNGFFKEFL